MKLRGWTEYRLVKETKTSGVHACENIFHRGTTPKHPHAGDHFAMLWAYPSVVFSGQQSGLMDQEQEDLLNRWSTLSQEQKGKFFWNSCRR